MKSEPKAFASLSSGLLARKGAARPAMRPQGFGQGGAGLEDLGWNDMGFEPPRPVATPLPEQSHETVDEKVADHPVLNGHAGLTPIQSPVHTQQAEIVGRLANDVGDELDETEELRDVQADAEIQPAVAAAPAVGTKQVPAPAIRRLRKSPVAPGSKGKAAFTLRLDPERHLKLRLASAVTSRSAQLLVTDALDQLLAEMPELDAMAQRAKRKD